MSDLPVMRTVELRRYVIERPAIERIEFDVLLTRKQVSEMLQTSEDTLDRWVERGEIAAIRKPGFVRFLLSDVRAFIDRHRQDVRQ